MSTGLLWYDDTDRPLADKGRLAAAHYERKFEMTPTICYIHPLPLNATPEEVAAIPQVVDGVHICTNHYILPHHFMVEAEEAEKEEER